MNKEPIEAVEKALHERDKLGFSVVNVIKKLDEISENVQEIELDDILQVAIPMDDWAALQDALDGMPERAESYSPNTVTISSEEWDAVKKDAERWNHLLENNLGADDFGNLVLVNLANTSKIKPNEALIESVDATLQSSQPQKG